MKSIFLRSICFSFLASGPALSEVTYIHTNHLGSVVAESSITGAITKRLHYKPFGDTIESQQDDVGYTGHKHDADISLTYMQARYYDPVVGRFFAGDPQGFRSDTPASFNRFAYASNNPYTYVDPDGEWIQLAIQAAVSAVSVGLYIHNNRDDWTFSGAAVAATAGFAGGKVIQAGAHLGRTYMAAMAPRVMLPTATITRNGILATAPTTEVMGLMGATGGTMVAGATLSVGANALTNIGSAVETGQLDNRNNYLAGSIMATKTGILGSLIEGTAPMRIGDGTADPATGKAVQILSGIVDGVLPTVAEAGYTSLQQEELEKSLDR